MMIAISFLKTVTAVAIEVKRHPHNQSIAEKSLLPQNNAPIKTADRKLNAL